MSEDQADIQWVRWPNYFRGEHGMSKWHVRFGQVWGERATVCNENINIIASIGLEQNGGPRGYYRRDGIENRPKKNVCKRCLKAAEKKGIRL